MFFIRRESFRLRLTFCRLVSDDVSVIYTEANLRFASLLIFWFRFFSPKKNFSGSTEMTFLTPNLCVQINVLQLYFIEESASLKKLLQPITAGLVAFLYQFIVV